MSRFRQKLSPANWVQGVTAISRKMPRLLGAKKMGSNMRPRYIQFRDIHDRDISGVHCINNQTMSFGLELNNKSSTMVTEVKQTKHTKELNMLC